MLEVNSNKKKNLYINNSSRIIIIPRILYIPIGMSMSSLLHPTYFQL